MKNLANLLVSSEKIRDLVGDRIYLQRFPQGVTLPSIRYQLVSSSPISSHSGQGDQGVHLVQVSVAALTFSEVDEIVEELYRILHNRSSLVRPGTSSIIVNDLSDYDPLSSVFFRHVDLEIFV